MSRYSLCFDARRGDGKPLWDWEAAAVSGQIWEACSQRRRVMWWRPTNDQHAIQVRVRVEADSLSAARSISADASIMLETNPDMTPYRLSGTVVEPWGESTGTH